MRHMTEPLKATMDSTSMRRNKQLRLSNFENKVVDWTQWTRMKCRSKEEKPAGKVTKKERVLTLSCHNYMFQRKNRYKERECQTMATCKCK